jgi:DNA polymerase-3 subunit epsilon
VLKENTSLEYAIVDIETTGGHAAGSGITEVAILIHDGKSIIDRYETLINPQRPIPYFIQVLTGINNEMVEEHPPFYEVAKKIYSLLDGRVFVAHNVNFDYSFLKHHLELAGYNFAATKLCTVRMSRKIKPGLKSYSLGRLCDALNIPMQNRHRAMGDAEATAILFSKLLDWDEEGHRVGMLKKTSKEQQLPSNLPKEMMDSLPSSPGVYYFMDKAGKVIYVGKAINIKKRVASHFVGHNPSLQRQSFINTICSIRFERCGTELMALLLEAAEIKRLWPLYNRAMKGFEPKYALFSYEDQNGYMRLAIDKLKKYHHGVHTFQKPSDAAHTLNKLIVNFNLDRSLCSFGNHTKVQSNFDRPVPEIYNSSVFKALEYLSNHLPSFAIVDRGRDEGEKSCIWVEKGVFYAMGYIDQYTDLNSPEDIKTSLTRYNSNTYMMQLISSYAEKYPWKVIEV